MLVVKRWQRGGAASRGERRDHVTPEKTMAERVVRVEHFCATQVAGEGQHQQPQPQQQPQQQQLDERVERRLRFVPQWDLLYCENYQVGTKARRHAPF